MSILTPEKRTEVLTMSLSVANGQRKAPLLVYKKTYYLPTLGPRRHSLRKSIICGIPGTISCEFAGILTLKVAP